MGELSTYRDRVPTIVPVRQLLDKSLRTRISKIAKSCKQFSIQILDSWELSDLRWDGASQLVILKGSIVRKIMKKNDNVLSDLNHDIKVISFFYLQLPEIRKISQLGRN
jgi:hypothetical protein